jgi:hypothetical protein
MHRTSHAAVVTRRLAGARALAPKLVVIVGMMAACSEKAQAPLVRPPGGSVNAVALTPADRKPAEGQDIVLGNGWYANVEIDDDDRIHLAWVDADKGDVLYTTVEPGGATPEPPSVVEHKGAVGSYLRLALAPGGVPVLAYYHQDERTLRLAHRPSDLATLASRGVVVDQTPPAAKPPLGGERMGEGFVGEDVTFGDHVGMAGSLFVDGQGVPHLTYYAKGSRYRYARREVGLPAFGPSANGRFLLQDVDKQGGSSFTMRSDLRVRDDGTVITSFCNWTFSDAMLKVGVKKPGAKVFDVVTWPETGGSDGWQSTLIDDGNAGFLVYSVAIGDQKLWESRFNPVDMLVPPERQERLTRPAAAIVRRRADGTSLALVRGNGSDPATDPSGVFLVELPRTGAPLKDRMLLDEGASTDPWIDLALRKDGRPVAVWTTSDHREMRIYAP